MAYRVRHAFQSPVANSDNGKVSSDYWNEDHVATGDPNTILGFDADGNATNIAPATLAVGSVADGDKGEVTVAGGVWSLDATAAAIVNKAQHVADRTALASASTGIPVAYLRESGREGVFVWNSSDLHTYVTADPNQGIYVPPVSDTTGASGAWVRKRDGDYLRPEWVGAAGDGVTDDTAAFVAMRTLFMALCGSASGQFRTGPTIRLSLKTYYLASSFSWKGGTARWTGESPGFETFDTACTKILMASGATFYLDDYRTELGVYNASPAIPYTSHGSIFENICFSGPGKGVGTASVVECHVEHYASNCRFVFGGKHGIWFNASHTDTGNNFGNANNCRHWNCLYLDNGGSGVAIGLVDGSGNGTDTNIIIISGGNFSYNTEYGIDDGSFLGGHYQGHFAGNGSGPFHVSNSNAVSRFSGYIESGQPNGVLNNRSTYNGMNSDTVTGPKLNAFNGFIACQPGMQVSVTNNSKTLTTTIGKGAQSVDTAPYVFEATYTDFNSGPPVSYFRGGTNDSYVIAGYGYTAANAKIVMSGGSGTGVYKHGRTSSTAGAIGMAGVFLGPEGTPDGRLIDTGTAAPTTGEHAQGEFRFNQSFSATGNFGWMNTTKATPGTWIALYSGYGQNQIGYATGAGGTVTQAASKSTGVTLNKLCGQVTMNAAALAAAAKVSFVVTNSQIAATDAIIANVASGGTANAYRVAVTAVAAGGFTITVENITAGSLSEAPVISFAVIKAVTA